MAAMAETIHFEMARPGRQAGEVIPPPPSPEPLSNHQRETAQYVTEMVLELKKMAEAAGLYTIAVALEFAYYEAFSMAHRVLVSPDELEQLRKLARLAREFGKIPDAATED